MSQSTQSTSLDPANPAAWAEQPFEASLALSWSEVEGPQRDALVRRFDGLRAGVSALDKLASRQGVDRVASITDAMPVFFDHRVYKSYPLSLIEKRQFDRLTSWMRRLTTQDITKIPLDGVRTVDDWIERLDDNGMIVVHSTGTSGKLSFIPRSQMEWPAWQNAWFEVQRAAQGFDPRTVQVVTFSTGYRTGHTTSAKVPQLFHRVAKGGEENRIPLYDYAISSDLLSLAGRLQAAEERGELDQLEFDPQLLEQRKQLIERSRHREEDLQRWFTKLVDEYRGQQVKITGLSAELVKLALAGREQGIKCEFAPGSVLFPGGGLKGFRDAPSDWEGLLKEFFGIDRLCSMYGMSECMSLAPLCSEGYFHFFPYTIPIVLDDDAVPLPTEGVQTGRMALFDLLAETYWGGFISGDRVTMHWDDDCPCGWKAPRIERTIVRYSELEGGDDKITCAGTAEAYNEFMDYVSAI